MQVTVVFESDQGRVWHEWKHHLHVKVTWLLSLEKEMVIDMGNLLGGEGSRRGSLVARQ